MLPHNKTSQEVDMLTLIVGECMKSQNTYGRKAEDLPNIVATFCFVLDDCSITQIMEAFRKWMKGSKDFPAPADIRAIIFPAKPEISLGEYLQACDYQKRNNFPLYSDAYEIKQQYEAQQREKREGWDKWHSEQLAIVQEKAPSLIGADKQEDSYDE